MRGWIRELFRRRDLLFAIAGREIRVKYKQSVMGMLWALLMPTIIVSAGLLIRYAFARLAGTSLDRDDLVLVTVKAAPWAFIVSSIRFSSTSLITNSNLVTKVAMPREIFPFAAILSQLLDFVIAGTALAIILIAIGVPIHLSILWVPLLVLLMIVFTAGVALFVSAAALFYRDVKYIVEVALTFAIFFTPVFYEVALFGRWSRILLLNPVAPLLEGLGAIATGRAMPAPIWFVYSAVIAVGGFLAAFVFFKRLDPYFAESI
jgi:homopolymeric O-antigen transport system permease protein